LLGLAFISRYCRPVATESSRRALTALTLPEVYDVKSIPGFMESVHVLRNPRKHAPIGLPDVFCSSLQWAGIVASFDVAFLAGAAYQVVEATAAAALLARKHDPRVQESRSGLIVSLYNGGFTLEFISKGLRMLQVPGHAPLGAFSPSLVYATTAHGAGVGSWRGKGLVSPSSHWGGPNSARTVLLTPRCIFAHGTSYVSWVCQPVTVENRGPFTLRAGQSSPSMQSSIP